ncbi:MAG: hypothetical protein OEZ58_05930 [Gammaproteobacteria bacterium]|nr:hypothetical protein [Gammaproteobacteria bacterium]MDH5728507.1 hypothetical protein [Gammaproteobacteria bacterium]
MSHVSFKRMVGFFLILFCTSAAAGKEKIPIRINIGAGYSDYRFEQAYQHQDLYVSATELAINAVVSQETIKKYKNKIPKKFRKAAGKLGEVSVGHIAVPQTLYLHPFDGRRKAWGGTWGVLPSFDLGLGPISFGLGGGVIASVMYHQDTQIKDSTFFARPGVRGEASLKLSLFDRYVILEAGVKKDYYLPQKFYSDHGVWKAAGYYAMIHFRIPFSVKAKI